jgi:membrane fusion protein (multidrug efflux system)
MSLPRLLRLSGLLVVIGSLGGGFYLINCAEADAPRQFTDNAYVQADLTVISPQVAGRVAEVHV